MFFWVDLLYNCGFTCCRILQVMSSEVYLYGPIWPVLANYTVCLVYNHLFRPLIPVRTFCLWKYFKEKSEKLDNIETKIIYLLFPLFFSSCYRDGFCFINKEFLICVFSSFQCSFLTMRTIMYSVIEQMVHLSTLWHYICYPSSWSIYYRCPLYKGSKKCTQLLAQLTERHTLGLHAS